MAGAHVSASEFSEARAAEKQVGVDAIKLRKNFYGRSLKVEAH
jgi:hypothetical protein